MSFIDEKKIIDSKPLPSEFLRGIDVNNYYDEELKQLNTSAFIFNSNPKGIYPTMDECSINWNDDINAFESQSLKKFGYSILSLDTVKSILINFIEMNLLTFGRDSEENNIYHGNLYIPKDLSKQRKTFIQCQLAFIASKNFKKN